MRTSILLVVALLCLGARAAPAAERPRTLKLAVLDVKTTGRFDPKEVAALTTFLVSEADRYAVKVLGGSDLQAFVGFERQKQILGCSDGSCLMELGGALGVDYLLSSEVGEVSGRWVFSVTLLDIVKSSVVKRAALPAKSQAELVDLVQPLLRDAFGGTLEAKPGAPPQATAARAEARSGGGTGLRSAGIALTTIGGLGLAGAGVFAFLGEGQNQAIKNGPFATPADIVAAADKGRTYNVGGWACLAGGAAVLGTGLVLLILGSSSSSAVAVTPVVGPSGAGLALSGALP